MNGRAEPVPATITYLVGDATDPIDTGGPRYIAHVCNDIGKWGAGFVLAVSRRWREPENTYRRVYAKQDGSGSLGSSHYVEVAENLAVVNMIAQRGVATAAHRHPLDLDALALCLRNLGTVARDGTVHMPRIGCGLAGGTWPEVEPIIRRELCGRGVNVYVYDL